MSESDDKIYELINETNVLANALFTDTIINNLENSKRKLLEDSKQKLYKTYSSVLEYLEQVKLLQTMKVGIIHTINNNLQNENFELYIDLIERSVKNIRSILGTNLRSDSSKIILKSEFEYIVNNSKKIVELFDTSEKITNLLNIDKLDVYEKDVSEREQGIRKIFQDLLNCHTQLENLQNVIINETSELLHDELID